MGAMFFLGFILLSPLPVLATLGGLHLIKNRFDLSPEAAKAAAKPARRRMFKDTPVRAPVVTAAQIMRKAA